MEPFADSQVVCEAESYNSGLLAVPGTVRLAAMPRVHSDCARLAAVKWAEKEPAVILRLCEYPRSRGDVARLSCPAG